MKTIITFGTFDILHPGHIRILERAKAEGDFLVVGVSSDELNYTKKQRYPFYNEETRMEMVAALRCVDKVFIEKSLELKQAYTEEHGADLLVMGDDWKGRFDHIKGCRVKYLPRTEGISTTAIKNNHVGEIFTPRDQ